MTQKKWTAENTEGFTEEELRELNDAQEHMEARAPNLDPETIADALNNSFFEDPTSLQLCHRAARFLGLT